MRLLFVTVGSVHSRQRSTVTDGGVDRNTSHVIFLMHLALVPSTCHPWCLMFERLLSLRVCLSPVCISLLPFLFHSLLVLCPAHELPQCRHRRRIKPLHSRTMRSIAPWRKYSSHRIRRPGRLEYGDFRRHAGSPLVESSSLRVNGCHHIVLCTAYEVCATTCEEFQDLD